MEAGDACVPRVGEHSGPAMSVSWWPAAHHRRMQERILDRVALQIQAALGEGAGLQEAGLQLGKCGGGWIRRPCAISPKKSRRFFDLAREIPEIHIADPRNSRKSPGVESIVKYTYKSTFPEIPGNSRKFEKVMFRLVFSVPGDSRKFPEIPASQKRCKIHV